MKKWSTKYSMLLMTAMLMLTGCAHGKKDTAPGINPGQSDLEYVQEKGTLIVGVTDYAPMDYRSGEAWTGFDAELANAFAESIDVTLQLKEIDWDKVKADGVNFAMIRVGYRGSSTGALVEDPYFEQNIKGALAAGVQVGIYFFTQATNEVEAVEEASMVIALCSGYDITYPVVIDTEGAGGNGRADGLDGEMRTAVCKAFCQTIQNAGYEAGVYASRNWMNNNLDMSQLDSYKVWLAEYRSTPLYQGYYDMWQYTSKGAVDGISGRVDLNISYLGY